MMKFLRQNIIADAWVLLTKRQRKASLLVAVGFLLTSITEVVALSSVAVFVSVLLDQEFLQTNQFMIAATEMLGNPEPRELVTILGFASAVLLIVGLGMGFAIQVLIDWLGVRFAQQLAHRYIRETINAPYSWIIQQNAPKIAQRLFNDPSSVGRVVYSSALELLYAGSLSTVAIAAIVIATPWHNLIAIAGLVAACVVAIAFIRPLIRLYSERQRVSTLECNKLGMEIITGAKEVLVKSRQEHFVRLFDQSFRRATINRMKMTWFQRLPPITFMLFGQIGLIAIALIMHYSGLSRGEIAGNMAFLVVIVGRLLPLISRTFGTTTKLAGAIPYIEALKTHFAEMESMGKAFLERRRGPKVGPEWRTITLSDVAYAYPNSSTHVINSVSLEIKRGGAYGFVGRSGAGKTTLIDLILGLYDPQGGIVEIDGESLSSFDPRSWYKRIGYVPQSPFISNDTLRRNVSFGLPDHDIDDGRVRNCLERAGMKEVLAGLEEGLNTMLGDNGLRLSGGQRQRVAIARALYDEPDLLIMDEATSALDSLTEKAIQETVRTLHGEVTTITIAHRLTTIKGCDRLFLMDAGRLVDSGTYEELHARNELFRQMADAGSPQAAELG